MSISKNSNWSNVIDVVYDVVQTKDGDFPKTLARTLDVIALYQVYNKTTDLNFKLNLFSFNVAFNLTTICHIIL